MDTKKLFADIAVRTNGEIYIGVVGPVRTGKSTFITRFMQSQIVPKIDDEHERARLVDELPQSADGVSIMTTQPRFVPAKATSIRVGSATMRVRMVDCVGYLVPGAAGHVVDGKVRNVKTPWSDSEMPFEKAAEIGTRKVIKEHSTVAVVITTDGSVSGIPRTNYIESEERVIAQLKKLGKPFVVVMNSRTPTTVEVTTIASEMAIKHGVAVLPMNVDQMSADDINLIFTSILAEFGVSGFKVTMPKWMTVLDAQNELITEAVEALKKHTQAIKRIADNDTSSVFAKSAHFQSLETTNIDVATGIITYNIVPNPDLYMRLLSSMSGTEIATEAHLVAFIRHFGEIKHEYDKLSSALTHAKEAGYGIVAPTFSDFSLEAPQLFRSGKSYGIKFRSSAPSLHLVRVDVGTQVAPVIGSKQQSEEMLRLLNAEYSQNAHGLWQTPIFGKSLESLVSEGITQKVNSMPHEAKRKMKRTITKIVNNGRGGVICILL